MSSSTITGGGDGGGATTTSTTSEPSPQDVASESRRSILRPISLGRSQQISQWQNELTINKLRFHQLGLYGRENETERLLECLEQAIHKKRQIVWIAGPSGAGKSSLAETLRRPTTRRTSTGGGRGIYMSGKFDWNRRDEPYAGIAAACGDLCGQLLQRLTMNNGDTVGSSISETLQAELASELGTLVRFLPVLEEILVASNPVCSPPNAERIIQTQSVGPVEANKNEFHYAFRRFMRAIGNYHSVVAVTLDDLQWANYESLELFHELITDRDNPNLLLVGCYRSDEVNESHVLYKVMNELESQSKFNGFASERMDLENLSLAQVNRMLMDLLSKPYENDTLALAQICHKKTMGNPFYLKNFLEMLQEHLLLEFNLGRAEWTWDEALIELKGQATVNVVDLLVQRMQNECADTNDMADLLRVAACLGSSFSENELTFIWSRLPITVGTERTMSVSDILSVAVENGFLMKGRRGEHQDYQFVHDKVQESALSLSSPEELNLLQTQIGNILVSELHQEVVGTKIFVAVNLLNGGPPPISLEARIRLAKLNLSAAEKAFGVSAMESASKYGSMGITHLPDDSWLKHTQLTLSLYSIVGESEGFLGRIESMESHCYAVLERDEISLLEKARLYNVLIDSVANGNRVWEAKKLCIQVLAKWKCTFPRNQLRRRLRIASGLRELQASIRTAKELSDATMMQDPTKWEAMKLLEKLATYCYITNDWELYLLVILREVQWTDHYGLNETATHAYSCAGLILTNIVGNLRKGSVYGEYALLVMDKLQIKRMEASTKFVVYSFVLHWTKPSHLMVKPLMQGYESGLRSGNVEYAMYGAYAYLLTALTIGRSLTSLEKDCGEYARQMKDFNREFVRIEICCIWQTVLKLMWPSESPCNLRGGVVDDENFLSTASPFIAGMIRLYQRYLSAFFGKYQHVAQLATEAEGLLPMKRAIPGSGQVLLEAFCTGISLFAAARETKNRKYRMAGIKVLKTVRKWVENGNPNVRHYEALMEAELAATNAKVHIAKKNFEVAIALASRRGFIQDAALAHERYGVFLMDHDEDDAAFHIGEAIRLNDEWGAGAKVAYLQSKYSKLLFRSPEEVIYLSNESPESGSEDQ